MESILFKSFILGTIQGLTEFLPVSSSGHLVVMRHALGVENMIASADVTFEVILHLGTLLAVIAVYARDLVRLLRDFFCGLKALIQRRPFHEVALAHPYFRLGLFILLASVPTAIMGYALRKQFESLFSNLWAVGVAFLITAVVLFMTRFKKPGEVEGASMGWLKALIIGVAQGLAITPGISRSGATISTALYLGVDRADAARFSFLLSIPAIVGAAVFKLKDLAIPTGAAGGIVIGLLSSAVIGFIALKILIKLVEGGRLHYFAYYVAAAGIGSLIYAGVR